MSKGCNVDGVEVHCSNEGYSLIVNLSKDSYTSKLNRDSIHTVQFKKILFYIFTHLLFKT